MERNLLTMTGAPATIRCVVPASVALLFREQFRYLPRIADPVTLRTACYYLDGSLMLPPGRVQPRQGVTVPRSEVERLDLDLDVIPAVFPDYAVPLLRLPHILSCLEQAGKILAFLDWVPGQRGVDAVQTAMSDIYIAAMAAEEHNPGIIFDRLSRADKAIINWFVGLGRNTYRKEHRRAQAGARGNQNGIRFVPFEDERRWRRNGVWVGEVAWSGNLDDEECRDHRLEGLAFLPSRIRTILNEVGQVGPRLAAQNLGIDRDEVRGAIREARVFLQARDLCQADLGEMSPKFQEVIHLTAQVGLQEAAARAGWSVAWVVMVIRSGRQMVEARTLLDTFALAGVPIPPAGREVLAHVARLGLRQAAQALHMTQAAVNSVVVEMRALLSSAQSATEK